MSRAGFGSPRLAPTLVLLVLVTAFAAAAAESPPPATSQDWQSQVQHAIAAQEYEITAKPAASCAPANHTGQPILQAPNRAQNLRSCFTAAGVLMVPRTGEAAWHWGLALSAFGDDAHLRPAAAVEPTATGNRVEYVRGPLTEWYVNAAGGLEQGFTLGAPVTDAGATLLRISAPGDLTPVARDGTVGLISAAGARVLDYGRLVARDAAGRELPATMRVVDGAIELRIATANAVYPVSIDPVVTLSAWIAESNQPAAELGWSVATAGDVNGDGYSDVIVGAPLYDNDENAEGRAFVYLGSATGLVAAPAWSAESNQPGANFGWSVATAGDVNGDGYGDVLVGAPYFDTSVQVEDEGRAFLYLGSATGLATAPAWSADSNQGFANFGWSVATAGDVNGDGYSDVIVGAPNFDDGEGNEGGAFVYLGGATGLATAFAWSAESDQAGANFGWSAATAGDVNGDGYSDVIVGAPLYTHGQFAEGRAFVYLGSATGPATTAAWTAESDQQDAQFAYSVFTAGDVNGDGYSDVIVGAPYYHDGETDEGGAFVYLGGATGLAAGAAWSAESNLASANFGWSVATIGDLNGDGRADVVVGAPGYHTTMTGVGRAYFYLGNSVSAVSPSAIVSITGGQVGLNLGVSVAAAGDVNGDGFSDIVVGAYGYSNGEAGEGGAFLILGGGDAIPTTPVPGFNVEYLGNQGGVHFGYSVAGAGDVNGDGYADVVVGAPEYDHGEMDEGAAFLYLGGPAGLALVADWMAESDHLLAHFGISVATAGDVNGDGYADVIVGAPGYSAFPSNEDGRAFIYMGGASGLAPAPAWTLISDQVNADVGGSVGTAGDVNGDGYADVIVGAPGYSNGETLEGRAYVFYGTPGGPSTVPAWMAESNQAHAEFGWSVGTAGDVNRDGYSDVIVGAPHYSNQESQEGRAFEFHGGPSGLSTTANWTAESDQQDASLGYSVATAGDVNGDGYSDVIVGAPTFESGTVKGGEARVYHGGATGLATVASFTGSIGIAGAQYGFSVASAGDVNADGYSDVIIGAPFYVDTVSQTVGGRAFVFAGSAQGVLNGDGAAIWSQSVNLPDVHYGWSVAGAGDVDGDGHADFLTSAPFISEDNPEDGLAYLYSGGPRELLPPAARQRRAGDTGPLAPLGASGSLGGVNLQAQGRGPLGRGDLKIEYEVKPLGQLLDGTGLQVAPAWTDSGTGSVALAAAVGSLAPGTAYHWRLRVIDRASTTPFLPHGPWLTPMANGPQETDFRTEKDSDVDGVFDRLDDCTLVANPGQLDADGDGYGNICDADLNNSGGVVNFADLARFRAAFGTTNASADLNGSGGLVNFADLALFRSLFGKPPGPSGLHP